MPILYRGHNLNTPGDVHWGENQTQLFKDMIDQISLNTAHREACEGKQPEQSCGNSTKLSRKKDVIKDRLAAINKRRIKCQL